MQIAGDFDGHADVAVQCGMHRPMEYIPGFTRSHWMMPSGECLHRIAPAAPKGHRFWLQTQITNKTQLLASDCTVAQAKSRMNFGTQKGPSTHVIDSTSCKKNVTQQTYRGRACAHCELSNIVSGQKLEKLFSLN
jgi:hypothetical protein